MGEGENEKRLSAYHIKQACEDSLKRMQTDHIDLYQMHHIDRETPWEEIWQAMEQLISQGRESSLCWQQQFCSLEHRPSTRRSQSAPFHGVGIRTKPV
jgi:hypothetical protein